MYPPSHRPVNPITLRRMLVVSLGEDVRLNSKEAENCAKLCDGYRNREVAGPPRAARFNA